MKKRLLPLAALAFAFVACDQNDDLVIDNTKDTPITIQSAGVAELSTRAVNELGYLVNEDGDEVVEMGVFVTNGSADKYNATNVKWTHDGSRWNAASPTLFEGAGTSQKIYAYYPYVEGSTGTITINAADQTDYLVAISEQLTASSVNLEMIHALTKLVLEATMGTEIAAEETITKVEVQNMYASGTLTIADNSWSELSETPDATLEMTNNEVLVIPMASCDSFPIVITTSAGRVFKTTISLANVGGKLVACNQYKITLKVGQDKVEVGGISATPWGAPDDGGLLETE